MTLARYVLVADEKALNFLLVDMQERRVVHGIPNLVHDIITGLVRGQQEIHDAVLAGGVPPPAEQRELIALDEAPHHNDVG